MQPRLSFTTVPDARRRLQRARSCWCCRKRLFRDEADARTYIGLILHTAHPKGLFQGDSFTLAPYRCRYLSGWHIGRDRRKLQIDFKAGHVLPAAPLVKGAASGNSV